jgi:hypothetical protein
MPRLPAPSRSSHTAALAITIAGLALAALSGCGHRRVYVIHHQAPAPPPRYVYVEAATPPSGTTFDAEAAKATLARVDMTPCREVGLPRGTGHARVTWSTSGDVSRVVVDSPTGLRPEAVACVGQHLGGARVPAYRGREASMGYGWHVR